MQLLRVRGSSVTCNSGLNPKQMKEHCRIDDECSMLRENTMTQMNFRARAHDRILRVARTIADLDGHGEILAEHVSEAVNYRMLDRQFWS